MSTNSEQPFTAHGDACDVVLLYQHIHDNVPELTPVQRTVAALSEFDIHVVFASVKGYADLVAERSGKALTALMTRACSAFIRVEFCSVGDGWDVAECRTQWVFGAHKGSGDPDVSTIAFDAAGRIDWSRVDDEKLALQRLATLLGLDESCCDALKSMLETYNRTWMIRLWRLIAAEAAKERTVAAALTDQAQGVDAAMAKVHNLNKAANVVKRIAPYACQN